MIFIDTNIFLRAILNDSPVSSRCQKLFKHIERGELDALTSDLVVAEVVFVLEGKIYRYQRDMIARIVMPMVLLPHLYTQSKLLWRDIFSMYRESTIDFIDAYNILTMQDRGVKEVYSYDKDFDMIHTIQRKEP